MGVRDLGIERQMRGRVMSCVRRSPSSWAMSACVYRVTRVNDTRFESLAFSTAEDMLLMLHVMDNDYHIRKRKVR